MGFARLYTLAMPFAGYELFDIDYEQAADVMYLTHVSHPPQKLSRYGEANWTINPVAFGTQAAAPTNVTAAASGSTGDAGYVGQTYYYVVTNVDATTGQESLQSNTASCVNDLSIAGHVNTVNWTGVANSDHYRLYREDAGTLGYIGQTKVTTFADVNFGPDTADSPPQNRQPFVVNNYPGRVALHQQRLFLGRTNSLPAGIYASRSADLENYDTSFPLKASDAISLQLLSRQVNTIEHMISLKGLMVLTRDTLFRITGSGDAPLSASDAPDIDPQSYRGCSRVRPAIVDDVVFFNTVKGAAIRTIGYTFEVDGYKGNDITVYAPHFFRGYTIVEMAWAEYPTATLWCVRSDGALVALTWQAEQNVWGWTLCDVGGVVESVASVTYNGEDTAYFVVRRYINGMDRRYVERIGRSNWTDFRQATFLDSALTYSGDPTAGLAGLGHLEGQVVDALADGFHIDGLTVTGGRVLLPQAFSQITVGLPFTATVETLPFESPQNPTQGRQKQVAGANVLVQDSLGLVGGQTSSTAFDLRTQDELPVGIGATPVPFSGYFKLDTEALWDDQATVTITQDKPYPMQVLSISPSYQIGG